MDLLKMIHELQAEKQRLDDAIQALERLVMSNSKPRGRPPSDIREDGRHSPSSAGFNQKERGRHSAAVKIVPEPVRPAEAESDNTDS